MEDADENRLFFFGAANCMEADHDSWGSQRSAPVQF